MSGIYTNTQAIPLPILNGGTGQATAQLAINALLPAQGPHGGKFLTTDGINVTWATVSGSGTVTSVNVATNNGITVSGNPITTSGTLTFGLSDIAPAGNITLANGSYIHADYTTEANRPMFQSNVTNGNTIIEIIPNGTATRAGITIDSSSDQVNGPYLFTGMNVSSTAFIVDTITRGIGAPLPLWLGSNNIIGVAIGITGNVTVATSLTVNNDLKVTDNFTLGNGSYFTGDFTNFANRPKFQTNVVGGDTILGFVPNGAGTRSAITFDTASSQTNDAFMLVGMDVESDEFCVSTATRGTGTPAPLWLGANNIPSIWVDVDGAVTVLTSLKVNGNMTLANGSYIRGDFTATPNRPMFQSNVADGITILEVVPNGTATRAGITFDNSSNQTDDSYMYVGMNSSSDAYAVSTAIRGTGTPLPLWLGSNNLARIVIGTTGDVAVGKGAPSTTATTDFFQIPVTTGTPTGVPTTVVSGYAPMMADSGGSKLWVYIGGTWKYATLT
jgi:hypothetical protein